MSSSAGSFKQRLSLEVGVYWKIIEQVSNRHSVDIVANAILFHFFLGEISNCPIHMTSFNALWLFVISSSLRSSRKRKHYKRTYSFSIDVAISACQIFNIVFVQITSLVMNFNYNISDLMENCAAVALEVNPTRKNHDTLKPY